jgi:hypothetical protein
MKENCHWSKYWKDVHKNVACKLLQQWEVNDKQKSL